MSGSTWRGRRGVRPALAAAAAAAILMGARAVERAQPAAAASGARPGIGALTFSAAAIPFAGANGIAVGDFNGDGFPDLAVTQYADGDGHQVAVLLGKGDGTFKAPVFYETGNGPYSVIAADFNGDGKADLAVTVAYENSVALLLGKGDGTFEAAKMTVVATYPHELAAGDFNHDGKLDIALNGSSNGFLAVLIGNGDGTFKPQVVYTDFSGTAPVLADFNGDGRLDVAVVGRERVGLMLGKGDGTFVEPVQVLIGHLPVAQVAADFNGDGKPDLAVVSSNAEAGSLGSLSIFLGSGAAGLKPRVDYPCGAQPRSVAAADVNGDGKIDLVVADAADSSLAVFLGRGDGTFGERSAVPHGGAGAAFAAAGDFNGDGRLDLAVASASKTLVVLLQAPAPAGR